MTNRIADHLTPADKEFLKTINFVPPDFKKTPCSPSGIFFDKLMDLLDPSIDTKVDGFWEVRDV